MTVDPNPAPDPRLADASWLRAPETQRVLAAVTAGGGEARIVGGAVRNTLMSRPVTDIDIATTVRPEDVLARAQAAGLSAIPTGLSHGTVTVIAGHQPFEVTTLRRDVETHGRHATVAFTEDWSSDAHRRDFTINALYCDAAGRLYDHTSGLDDLAAHRVRFIGRAEDRIAEDYLRILRFYRFTAEYAEGSIDREGHEACAATQEGLDLISAERIRAELLKLLAAPHAPIVVSEMDEAGLLTRILGAPADVVTFARLAALERALGLPPDPIRRLIALAAPDAGARLRDRLRLSNAEATRISDLNLPDLHVRSRRLRRRSQVLHLPSRRRDIPRRRPPDLGARSRKPAIRSCPPKPAGARRPLDCPDAARQRQRPARPRRPRRPADGRHPRAVRRLVDRRRLPC